MVAIGFLELPANMHVQNIIHKQLHINEYKDSLKQDSYQKKKIS